MLQWSLNNVGEERKKKEKRKKKRHDNNRFLQKLWQKPNNEHPVHTSQDHGVCAYAYAHDCFIHRANRLNKTPIIMYKARATGTVQLVQCVISGKSFNEENQSRPTDITVCSLKLFS
jgi:hypothetical protein